MATTKSNMHVGHKRAGNLNNESDTLQFDVTSGGFLHVSLSKLIESKAAKRQIEAVEELEELSNLQKKKQSK